MAEQALPERTVSVTVAGHEVYNGKPLTKLDIPEWGSKYPIPLYGTSQAVQDQLPIGETLDVVLQADNLKQGQDGSKPWMYFWSFVKIADGLPPSASQQPQEAPSRPQEASSAPQQSKDTAIRRAAALKAAAELLTGLQDSDAVLSMADKFDEWLQR